MPVPVDPGISLQDNVQEPILLEGATGLHERFLRLYNSLDGALDETNLDPDLLGLVEQAYYSGSQKPGAMQNVSFSFGGTGNGTLTIHQADGSAFADTDGNRGYVWMRSATSGRIIRGKITANVSIPLVGAHWGAGTKGDITGSGIYHEPILRIYCINDGNTLDDFTPKWGVCYQGGLQYVYAAKCSATSTNINTSREVLVNSAIINDDSPCSDVGYIRAEFDDTGNVNGEDFWTITSVFPGESADGLWQRFNVNSNNVTTGFSSFDGNNSALFSMVGSTVFIRGSLFGTSNSTSFSFNAPIMHNGPSKTGIILNVDDNGTAQTAPGHWAMGSSSETVDFSKVNGSAAFTAANNKGCSFDFCYEALEHA